MYIPNEFKEVRLEETMSIINDFPLACIVANTEKGLIATHIPLIMKDKNILIGHMALNNEVKELVNENQEILCIFKGDDAYISANYYPSKFEDHKKVPTWNYQVVHIYGYIKFFTENKIKLSSLGKLTTINEKKVNGKAGWKMSEAPKEYLLSLLDELVVFEINISRIQAQSKLSQDKEQKDIDSVIKELKNRGNKKLIESMLRAKL